MSTEQHHVGVVGAAAGFPPHDVVYVGPFGWFVAAGEHAVAVADEHGSSLRHRREVDLAALVEYFAAAAQHHGDDAGVAQQPSGGVGRDDGAVGELADRVQRQLVLRGEVVDQQKEQRSWRPRRRPGGFGQVLVSHLGGRVTRGVAFGGGRDERFGGEDSSGDLDEGFGAAVLDGRRFPTLRVAVGVHGPPQLIGDLINRVFDGAAVFGGPLGEQRPHTGVTVEERRPLLSPQPLTTRRAVIAIGVGDETMRLLAQVLRRRRLGAVDQLAGLVEQLVGHHRSDGVDMARRDLPVLQRVGQRRQRLHRLRPAHPLLRVSRRHFRLGGQPPLRIGRPSAFAPSRRSNAASARASHTSSRPRTEAADFSAAPNSGADSSSTGNASNDSSTPNLAPRSRGAPNNTMPQV